MQPPPLPGVVLRQSSSKQLQSNNAPDLESSSASKKSLSGLRTPCTASQSAIVPLARDGSRPSSTASLLSIKSNPRLGVKDQPRPQPPPRTRRETGKTASFLASGEDSCDSAAGDGNKKKSLRSSRSLRGSVVDGEGAAAEAEESAATVTDVVDPVPAVMRTLNLSRSVAAHALAHAPAEMRRLLVFAPRLTSFQHRGIHSLRHPRCTQEIWRTPMLFGRPRSDATSSEDAAALKAAVLDPLGIGLGGTSAAAMAAGRWTVASAAHDHLCEGTPEVAEARAAVESDPRFGAVVRRFWSRLVGFSASSTAHARGRTAEANAAGATTRTAAAAAAARRRLAGAAAAAAAAVPTEPCDPCDESICIPATAYIYLELRFVTILLDGSAIGDAVDMAIAEFEVDARRSIAHAAAQEAAAAEAEAAAAAALSGGGDVRGDDAPASTGAQSARGPPAPGKKVLTPTPPQRSLPSVLSPALLATATSAAAVAHAHTLGVSFPIFAASMFELADNWTSTTHPDEYVAFLTDLCVRTFGVDWASDTDAAFQVAIKTHVPDSVALTNFAMWQMRHQQQKKHFMSKFISAIEAEEIEKRAADEAARKEIEALEKAAEALASGGGAAVSGGSSGVAGSEGATKKERQKRPHRRSKTAGEGGGGGPLDDDDDGGEEDEGLFARDQLDSVSSSEETESEDDEEKAKPPSNKKKRNGLIADNGMPRMSKQEMTRLSRERRLVRRLAERTVYRALPIKLVAMTTRMTLGGAVAEARARYFPSAGPSPPPRPPGSAGSRLQAPSRPETPALPPINGTAAAAASPAPTPVTSETTQVVLVTPPPRPPQQLPRSSREASLLVPPAPDGAVDTVTTSTAKATGEVETAGPASAEPKEDAERSTLVVVQTTTEGEATRPTPSWNALPPALSRFEQLGRAPLPAFSRAPTAAGLFDGVGFAGDSGAGELSLRTTEDPSSRRGSENDATATDRTDAEARPGRPPGGVAVFAAGVLPPPVRRGTTALSPTALLSPFLSTAVTPAQAPSAVLESTSEGAHDWSRTAAGAFNPMDSIDEVAARAAAHWPSSMDTASTTPTSEQFSQSPASTCATPSAPPVRRATALPGTF